MNTPKTMIERATATLVLAAILTAPAHAQSGGLSADGDSLSGTGAFGNEHIVLRFDASGQDFELVSLRNRDRAARTIEMTDGSGGWTVRLAEKGTDPVRWFQFSSDGAVLDSNGGSTLGTLDALALDVVRLHHATKTLQVSWAGQVTFAGASTGFRVTTRWRLVAGKPYAATLLTASLKEPGALPFYMSRVLYPKIAVEAFDTAGDTLVVPFVTGSLIRDPTDPGHLFPPWLGTEDNFYPVSVSGYYDADDPYSTCFIYGADPGDEHWKELLLEATPDGPTPTEPGHLTFRYSHLPSDIFDRKSYTTPYPVLVGAVEGDWWRVADVYRALLKEQVPWYAGPVGSPAHPMPAGVKDLVAEVLMQPGFGGDHMDIMNRQMMNLLRVLGPQVNAIWYGWHAPDTFGHFQFEGSLPGRPSLGAAIREGQKQGDIIVSPYYNSSEGVDYLDVEPPLDDPTPMMLAVQESFLIQENGEAEFAPLNHGPPRAGYLCPAAVWWRTHMPTELAEIAEFTDMHGVYLDVFLTGPCFEADDPDHDHAPGGGTWMNTDRMQQLKDLKANLLSIHPAPGDFAIAMEFVIGRFSEEVHIMHHDPAGNLMSDEKPGQTGAVPLANAVTIPFFRAVYDNIKIGRITAEHPGVTGRRAWIVANNVLTFGQIPSITRPALELVPLFSQRFTIAPFFQFPGPSTDILPPVGENAPDEGGSPGGSEDVTVPIGDIDFTVNQQPSFNTPFYEYLRDLTTALRGDIPALGSGQAGLLTWHNGTIRRLPDYTITQTGGPPFTGIPGVDFDTDPTTPYTMTPVYTTEFPNGSTDPYPNPVGPQLVPGMFQAPADIPGPNANSLAFVMTNPWVDPTQTGTFQVDFDLDPHEHPGWGPSGLAGYTVVRYDASGNPPQPLGSFSGTFHHVDTLSPGDIVWWVFRQL